MAKTSKGMLTDTMYAGGTPTFDETTGQPISPTGGVKGEPTKQAPIVVDDPTPAPAPETPAEMTFTFVEGRERGGAQQNYLYGQEGEVQQLTVSELRDYFESDKVNRLPEVFGTFDNYLAYMTEREQLIQSGDYDTGNWAEADTGFSEDQEMILEGDADLTIDPSDPGQNLENLRRQQTSTQQGAYNNWINSEANQALLQKYGVNPVVYSNSGDKFQWNGSAYVKTVNEDHAGFADFVKMGITTAIGIMSGGALAPALGGVGSAVVSNAITQAITTGSIDPEQLLQTAATAGLGQAVTDIIGPAISDAINIDLSEITGIEEVDNVLNAMGQTAIRQAVFDGELDMDQIVSSGLFAGAQEVAGFLLDGITGQQGISEERQREIEQRVAEYAGIVNEDTMEEVNRIMGDTVNTAIADQQNEAIANQLRDLSGNLQAIYEDAYAVSPEPTGPSVDDFMANSVDDADSELADTTADLTDDTTVQPEPMAQIRDPFAERVSENGLVYASDENGNMRLVGIDQSSSPQDLLAGIKELAGGDIYGHQFADGRSVISLNEDMITALVNQAGGASELAAYLEDAGIYVVFDSRSNNLVALMSEDENFVGGLHTNVNADSYLDDEWSPPSINERAVPPPEPPVPEVLQDLESINLEELQESSVAPEAPDTPLNLEVEVDPFEYEEDPIQTPELPPEPDPVDPVDPLTTDEQQTPGETGTQPTTPPEEDTPITSGLFPEYLSEPEPAPAPAPAPAPEPAAQLRLLNQHQHQLRLLHRLLLQFKVRKEIRAKMVLTE